MPLQRGHVTTPAARIPSSTVFKLPSQTSAETAPERWLERAGLHVMRIFPPVIPMPEQAGQAGRASFGSAPKHSRSDF